MSDVDLINAFIDKNIVIVLQGKSNKSSLFLIVFGIKLYTQRCKVPLTTLLYNSGIGIK